MPPAGESRFDIRFHADCQDAGEERSSDAEEDRAETSGAHEGDHKIGHEEDQGRPEIAHQDKGSHAAAGEADEQQQVLLREQMVQRRRSGVDEKDLDEFRGLERKAADAQPVLRAEHPLAEDQVYREQEQSRRGGRDTQLLGQIDVAQERADDEIQNDPGKEKQDLTHHLIGGRRTADGETGRCQKQGDGLSLERPPAQDTREEIGDPCDSNQTEKA